LKGLGALNGSLQVQILLERQERFFFFNKKNLQNRKGIHKSSQMCHKMLTQNLTASIQNLTFDFASLKIASRKILRAFVNFVRK